MLKLKNSILKIAIIMIVLVALIMPSMAYASDGAITVLTPGGTTNPTPTPSTTTPTPSATNTPKPTTTPSTKLPQTGIEDYTGLIFVTIALAGSAVFAYKKMKDYDNI